MAACRLTGRRRLGGCFTAEPAEARAIQACHRAPVLPDNAAVPARGGDSPHDPGPGRPAAVLQFDQGDWHRAQNVWRSWMLEHNVPRRDARRLRPLIHGCTGDHCPGLKNAAATELQFLASHARENILPDYWNQDAGWHPCGEGWWNVGTWEVDRSRRPNGLRQSGDWLHAHQARQIVWSEPERAAGGSWLTLYHPEWCFGGAGGGLMRIGDAGDRQWITARIDQ